MRKLPTNDQKSYATYYSNKLLELSPDEHQTVDQHIA